MSTGQNKNSLHYNNKFGSWLKEELENRGWSQKELCKRAGIKNETTVSMWITGKKLKRPDLRHCVNLAKALDLPWQTVVVRAYSELIPPGANADLQDEIIYLWSQLSEEERHILHKMLLGVVDHR